MIFSYMSFTGSNSHNRLPFFPYITRQNEAFSAQFPAQQLSKQPPHESEAAIAPLFAGARNRCRW